MGVYSEGLQRIIARDDLSLKASSAETVSTTSDAVEIGDKAQAYVAVDVDVVSGTSPTMLITIEGSHDNVNWFTLGRIGANGYDLGATVATAPTNITATGTYRGSFPAMRYMRSRSTIGGTTPSFDYSVGGNAA